MMLKTKIVLAVLIGLFVPTVILAQRVSGTSAPKTNNSVKYQMRYAMCPPEFKRIGNECYYISKQKVNFNDAQFDCKDRDSKLAELKKFPDRIVRKYLNKMKDKVREPIWIGARFNEKRKAWNWGFYSKAVKHQSFSLMDPNQDLSFHCAVLRPELRYRWAPVPCIEEHYYLCQHKMPYVSYKHTERIYRKWNETYPNQIANVELDIIPRTTTLKTPTNLVSMPLVETPSFGHLDAPQTTLRPIIRYTIPKTRKNIQKIVNDVSKDLRGVPGTTQSPYKHDRIKPHGQMKLRSYNSLRNPIVAIAPDPLDEINVNGNDDQLFDEEKYHRLSSISEGRVQKPTSAIPPTTFLAQKFEKQQMKQFKLQQLKNRLSKLNPEEQDEFYRLKAEQKKKKDRGKAPKIENETVE